ncbi:FBD-associated F-box protein At2g26860 [Triticum aestivum]|uniref:FBD-associated F-box protein At2g26860 n=1 Tax=Triticum aestivum TaxID=4565 RepID=UPI001D020D35|nr:FBD-associated F-box protein At2g26860-like [Triticum aestivum]
MELRSRRFIASGEARRRARLGFTPSEPDHISALPDELLLLVLARLGCVATAARTSVLARRWRGLWTWLLDLAFPDVPFRSLGKALDALGRKDTVVSSFHIRVADQPGSTRAVSSLLRAAAWFLPVDLAVAVPSGVAYLRHPVELPCFGFKRTATISLLMDSNPVELRLPTPAALAAADVGECLFPALTTLNLCGYYTHDGLAALLPHCPLLRVLRYAVRYRRPCDEDYAITVKSPTLRELLMEESGVNYVRRIDMVTPALEHLTVSVLAPMAENVSWRCRYGGGWFRACTTGALTIGARVRFPSDLVKSPPIPGFGLASMPSQSPSA